MRRSLSYLFPKDLKTKSPYLFEVLRFMKNLEFIPYLKFFFDESITLSKKEKVKILRHFFFINTKVDSPHRQSEILSFVKAMFDRLSTNGNFAECGCYKGSSTAKFSIICKILGKKLFVFDSFEGIPDNKENHDFNIYGEKSGFGKGDFAGSLEEVKSNVKKYGDIDSCIFIKGWFENTLKGFEEEISALYIDVDLASSTKTCLKYLYPKMRPGSIIMSQDGHLPLVIDVFKDNIFWKDEFKISPPEIQGLGTKKLIYFAKN